MSDAILSPTFLFRFAIPFRQHAWPDAPEGLELGDKYVLPSFGELEKRPLYADLRGAWHPRGLMFTVRVRGKKQRLWCRPSRLEDSDGWQLWVDTRDSHNIHRANRFCHRFAFLPTGEGARHDQAAGGLTPINRAREAPRPSDVRQLRFAAQCSDGGYDMQVLIPASCLTGYDSGEHPRLGFSYAVVDREFGWQTLSVGPEFPITEDPSLWGTLELIRDGS